MSIQSLPLDDDADATGEYNVPRVRPPHVSLEISAETDVGKVRTNNEDHYLVAKLAKSMRICRTSLPEDWETKFSDEEGFLMVVADGMGGMAGGERASRLAVETIEEFVLNVVKWFLHLESEDTEIFKELRGAFNRADDSVVRKAQAEPRLRGMGTTVTMAYSVGADLFLVHAGDSRAYMMRNGQLRQITDDHTLVNILVKGGAITPDAARRHARRNVITNVIGGPNPGVETEIHRIGVEDGDLLLICSDGLTEAVDDLKIASVLGQNRPPDHTCKRLIELALQGGAPDNVTVLVCRYTVK